MFTKTLHSEVYPDIDPTKGQFSEPLVVVVIGASRGIGEHIAKAYASAKASTIVLAARSADRLKEVEGEIRNTDSSVDIRRYPCDVTSTDSVAALAASIEKDIGRLDVVVYNSGFAGPCYDKLHEIDPKDFQDAFAINPVGTYLAGHYLIPLLLKSPNGAKTFLTVSTTGCWVREGPLMNTQYFTSKLAQERITELIGTQYREDGLFAAALHPGGVVTKMAQDSMPKQFMGCKYTHHNPEAIRRYQATEN